MSIHRFAVVRTSSLPSSSSRITSILALIIICIILLAYMTHRNKSLLSLSSQIEPFQTLSISGVVVASCIVCTSIKASIMSIQLFRTSEMSSTKQKTPASPDYTNDIVFESAVEVTPLGVQIVTSRAPRHHTWWSCSTPKKMAVVRREFIPRELILDVIIQELVLSYKVVSCVCFRLLVPDEEELQHGNQEDCYNEHHRYYDYDIDDVSNEAAEAQNDNSVMDDDGSTGSENSYHKVNRTRPLSSLASGSSSFSSTSTSKTPLNMIDMMKGGKVKLLPAYPNVEMTYGECETMWEGIMTSLGLL